jgi:hypothetical protein
MQEAYGVRQSGTCAVSRDLRAQDSGSQQRLAGPYAQLSELTLLCS